MKRGSGVAALALAAVSALAWGGGGAGARLVRTSIASPDLVLWCGTTPSPEPCAEWSCDLATRRWIVLPYDYGTECGSGATCDGMGSCVLPTTMPALAASDARATGETLVSNALACPRAAGSW